MTPLSDTAQVFRADLIRQYAKAGYALTPCRADKTAKNERWQMTLPDATTTLESLGSPPMAGAVLQDDDAVLDVDPRRYLLDENGIQINQLTSLWQKLKLPSITDLNPFIVETGGGGWHIYLKKPADFKLRGVVPGFPAIEIKSRGNYVCVAGSINKDGKLYKIAKGSPAVHVQMPQVLLDYAFQPLSVVRSAIDDDQLDDPNAVWRFTKYLQTCEDPESGAYKRAGVGHDWGLSEQVIGDLMIEHLLPRRLSNPKTEGEIRSIASHIKDYAKNPVGSSHPANDFQDVNPEELAKQAPNVPNTSNGTIPATKKKTSKSKATVNVVSVFFEPGIKDEPNPLFNLVRFNLRSERIEFNKPAPWNEKLERKPKSWSDFDDLELQLYLSAKHKIEISATACANAAIVAARRRAYDPIEEYLTSTEWDKKPRLESLFPFYAGAEDNDYTREVGRIFTIGAVARALDPGCQFDTIVVLQGKQGKGKTQFVKTLGGPWYLDAHIDPRKLHDTVQQLKGRWICEISEMTPAKYDDQEALKAFVSRQEDVVRFAYGRHMNESERGAVFIGTTNQTQYHRDPTGNRRYLSIATGDFNLAALAEDRDQIFAEAYTRWKNKENCYITDSEILAAAAAEQESRQESEPWAEEIQTWLEDPIFSPPEFITSSVIATYLCIPLNRQTQITSKRIANVMRKLGYEHKQVRDPDRHYKDSPIRVWVKEDANLSSEP